MYPVRFIALTTETVSHYQSGGEDAYHQKPVSLISDGLGAPCRHCLSDIKKGDAMLLVAHRPFEKQGPFSETGPIFVHAKPCTRHNPSPTLPPMLTVRDKVLIRGYTDRETISYGTGEVIATSSLEDKAATLLQNPEIAFIHIRSSTYNCFSCRIERAEPLSLDGPR